MKIFASLLFSLCLNAFTAQATPCTIVIDTYLRSAEFQSENRNYQWIVNGDTVRTNYEKFLVDTHYPNVDTVVFSSDRLATVDTIITRFKPEETYFFTIGCCNDYFRMLEAQTYHFFRDAPPQGQRLEEVLEVHTGVNITVENGSAGDSLEVSYGDPVVLLWDRFPIENGASIVVAEPALTDDFNMFLALQLCYISKNEERENKCSRTLKFQFFGSEQVLLGYDVSNNSIRIDGLK